MNDERLFEEIERLKAVYGAVCVSSEPSTPKLLQVGQAPLPRGCAPGKTKVLLRIMPGQPRPEVFVQPGIKLPNGKEPRSTSVVLIAGQDWLQFSYSFPWDETQNTLDHFVATALRRFAKNE